MQSVGTVQILRSRCNSSRKLHRIAAPPSSTWAAVRPRRRPVDARLPCQCSGRFTRGDPSCAAAPGGSCEHHGLLVDDITQATLPEQRYAVWHDRAVFHFLIEPEQRAAYVREVLRSLAANGHLVMATFGPDGPQRCSGLEVVRHDIGLLCEHLGPPLRSC